MAETNRTGLSDVMKGSLSAVMIHAALSFLRGPRAAGAANRGGRRGGGRTGPLRGRVRARSAAPPSLAWASFHLRAERFGRRVGGTSGPHLEGPRYGGLRRRAGGAAPPPAI